MKKIYQTPVAVCCPMTAQGYLLAGSNRIKGIVVEHKSTQTVDYSEIHIGQEQEEFGSSDLAKKSYDPWSSWDE